MKFFSICFSLFFCVSTVLSSDIDLDAQGLFRQSHIRQMVTRAINSLPEGRHDQKPEKKAVGLELDDVVVTVGHTKATEKYDFVSRDIKLNITHDGAKIGHVILIENRELPSHGKLKHPYAKVPGYFLLRKIAIDNAHQGGGLGGDALAKVILMSKYFAERSDAYKTLTLQCADYEPYEDDAG